MRIAVLDSNHFEMEITGKKLFSELELIKTPDFIILASTRKSMSSKKRLIL
jgi:hypothetical protein